MEKSLHSGPQEHLRKLLREVRLEANLRQADLAKRLKQPQSFVSKYESGERILDFLEVRRVCNALEIPFLDFVRRFEGSLK